MSIERIVRRICFWIVDLVQAVIVYLRSSAAHLVPYPAPRSFARLLDSKEVPPFVSCCRAHAELYSVPPSLWAGQRVCKAATVKIFQPIHTHSDALHDSDS